jgi:hypothetical protein
MKDVSLYLDRDSSLNRAITQSLDHSAFIDDDVLAVDDNRRLNACGPGGSNELTIIAEAVSPFLLVYGNLKKITNASRTFMLDASNIETCWVLEEALLRWVERATFDPVGRARMRRLIKHVGPMILKSKEAGKVFEALKSTSSLMSYQPTNRRASLSSREHKHPSTKQK